MNAGGSDQPAPVREVRRTADDPVAVEHEQLLIVCEEIE
jgi:hypothetical protein